MKSVTEEKEKQIGYLLMGGAGCFLFGLFCTFIAFILGVGVLWALGPLSALAGLGLAGVGVLMGYQHHTSRSNPRAPSVPVEGRIVARFAINEIKEMLFDVQDYDPEELQYYVRVHYLGGRRDELECARPVFDQCGEGMRGMMTVEGGWLAQFVPLLDTDETRAMYRD